MTRRPHDIFFRHVFQNPKRTADLLQIAAKHNVRLQDFLNAVNMETLAEITPIFTESGEAGLADIAFTVSVKSDSTKQAELLVVIIYNGKGPWKGFNQCMYPEYPAYFQQIRLPFICEFIDVGGEINPLDFENLDPQTSLALIAMKYAFDGPKLSRYFVPALKAFLESHQEGCASFVDEIMVYLQGCLEKRDKEHLMDLISTKEAYGYETIADAEFADGSLSAKRDMVKAMLTEGLPVGTIARISGLSESEILKLK